MATSYDPKHVAKRRKRVQTACDRCRRQKLRCGLERPCPLCVLSDVPCIPQTRISHPKRKKARSRAVDRALFSSPSQGSGLHAAPSHDHDHDDDHIHVQIESSPLQQAVDIDCQRRDHVRFAMNAEGDESGFTRSSAPDDETPFRQRTSSFGMFREIIDQFSPDMVVNGSASALPGGNRTRAPTPTPQLASSVEEMLGMKLPEKAEIAFLIESYMTSVHWFMMLFYEPSFRARCEALLVSSHLDRSQQRFAILFLLILGLGARYADPERVKENCPNLDSETFQRTAIKKVEGFMLELFDEAELESVQICVLLGSYYLYNGRPNLGFVILGSGIRCAQSMSLHREIASSNVHRIVKEERRRVWWALYIFDRFASIVYGRPCGIRDGEFNVAVPENIEDTDTMHPEFNTKGASPNGTMEHVTLFSYTKFKIRLYRIASPIVGDMYFHRASDIPTLRRKVQRIDGELTTYFNTLPPELRLDKLFQANRSPGEETPERIFSMQALALQVAYDNILILLHRPLLPLTLRGPISPATDDTSELQQIQHISQDRCWESALRTSILGNYKACLESARQTHAAAFLGINLFTAGMVLCIVALSKPLSEPAQQAKHAVGRILSLARLLEGRILLLSQTSKVLADIVRLIMDKELKAILGQSDPLLVSAPGPYVPASAPTTGAVGWNNLPSNDIESTAANVSNSHNGQGQDCGNMMTSFDGLGQFPGEYVSTLSDFDLQHGLHSLQQAMYLPVNSGPASMNGAACPDQCTPGMGDGLMAPDIGRLGGNHNNLEALCQSWLWEPDQWQGFNDAFQM